VARRAAAVRRVARVEEGWAVGVAMGWSLGGVGGAGRFG